MENWHLFTAAFVLSLVDPVSFQDLAYITWVCVREWSKQAHRKRGAFWVPCLSNAPSKAMLYTFIRAWNVGAFF